MRCLKSNEDIFEMSLFFLLMALPLKKKQCWGLADHSGCFFFLGLQPLEDGHLNRAVQQPRALYYVHLYNIINLPRCQGSYVLRVAELIAHQETLSLFHLHRKEDCCEESEYYELGWPLTPQGIPSFWHVTRPSTPKLGPTLLHLAVSMYERWHIIPQSSPE